MNSFLDSWRRHLWLWVLPLGFCVLNLLGVAFYWWAFAGQVETLETRYRQANERLAEIQEEQEVIQNFLGRVDIHRQEIQGLHSGRFQTEEERFTQVIQEVKKLARQAGLRPSSLSYPRKTFASHGLIQRNINFSVKGSYDQLRSFINFLELTEHFITLNSVTLGESGNDQRNPTLNIRLVVSTIFSKRSTEAPKAPEGPAS